MAEQESSDNGWRFDVRRLSKRGGDMIAVAGLVVLGVYGWIEAGNFVEETGMVRTLSPAFFPRTLLAGVVIFALLLLINGLVRKAASEGQVFQQYWYKIPVAIVIMFAQVYLFEQIGAFPAIWLALLLLLVLAGVRPLKSLLIATGFLAFVFLFFIEFLGVKLPTEFLLKF